jgi:hypothetical protein
VAAKTLVLPVWSVRPATTERLQELRQYDIEEAQARSHVLLCT